MAGKVLISSTQKAALVLLALGRERAAKIMAHFDDAEIEAIAVEIVRMEMVDESLAKNAVEEFHESWRTGKKLIGRGGLGLAQSLLNDALGSDRAADVLDRMATSLQGQPFEFLHNADARQVIALLTGEHAQTVATVLTHLRPEHAAQILPGLEPTMQKSVGFRIAQMDRAAPEAVKAIADTLRRKASTVLTPKEMTAAGGIQPLVEILNRVDAGTEKTMFEGIEDKDVELAEEVRSRMFVFGDIILLEDRAVQIVLRQVATPELALALKGAADQVKDKVLRNLSERARENLLEEIDIQGSVRLSQVDEARSGIVKIIRGLEESGEIVIRRDGDDEYVS